MTKEKLIIEDGKKGNACSLKLTTPYKTIETDRYIVFAKTDKDENGNTNHIEVNNLDFSEIVNFHNQLSLLIIENERKIKGEK